METRERPFFFLSKTVISKPLPVVGTHVGFQGQRSEKTGCTVEIDYSDIPEDPLGVGVRVPWRNDFPDCTSSEVEVKRFEEPLRFSFKLRKYTKTVEKIIKTRKPYY